MRNSSNKTALFVALSGIGNLLMQLPTIEAFKKAHPEWRVVVWVAPRGTKPLAEACPFIDEVIEGKIKRSLLGHLRLTQRLRHYQPDLAIMLSPGQLWKGAVYMFLSGAPLRLAHRYPHLGNPHSDLLLTKSMVEEENIHDLEQNIRLLELLGMDTTHVQGQPYHWHVPKSKTEQATHFVRGLSVHDNRQLIGIHAGSAPEFMWKRWPLEHFAHVARALIANQRAHILLFGGPDEKKQIRQLKRLIDQPHVSLVNTDLLTVAEIMRHCQLFLANDSGLMHLAAAVGIPTIGIFGPTSEKNTGPRGVKSHVVRAPHTKPVYDTEHNYNLGTEPHKTLLAVTPTMVLEAIAKYL